MTMFLRPGYMARPVISTVSTIAKPPKMAPATKYGGKIVVCQPGMTDVAKSNETTECTREHQRRRDAGQDQVARS